jgi:uncharacterized protein (TIGR01777 family)
VLAAEGGALTRLALSVRFGLGAALGNGRQWLPWVHIDDLIAIYMQALTDERMQGPYNVVASEHVTNAEFMHTLARVLGRPFFLPPVPGFAMRLALGELSEVLLKGSRASNARLLGTGFQFRHPRLEEALRSLLVTKV